MNNQFATELQTAFYEMSRYVVGWEEQLVQVMFGLATREHVFWLSPAGRAKSWVARMAFGLFPDAKRFCIQITKEMSPSALFGNEIPEEYLKSGKEIYNLDGGVCSVNFVFLDEFLDGPDYLVRALNSVLNERIFERKDQQVMAVPLHSGIMTTNFDRYGTALEAVRDRMMCKSVIFRVEGLVDRMSMYQSYLQYPGSTPLLPKLAFQDLKEFADEVESPTAIKIAPEILLIHALLLQQYIARREKKARETIAAKNPDRVDEITEDELGLEKVSPRTESKLNDFTRASALLSGRHEVDFSDLEAMRFGLITLGSGNGDEQVWQEVLGDCIPKSQSQIKRVRELAAISEKIGELKKLDDSWTDSSVLIAGKVETFTRLTLVELIDRISRGGGGPVPAIASQLTEEARSLGKKRISPFLRKP